MKNFEKTDEIDVLKELSSLDIADSNKLHNCALRLRGLAAKLISTIDEPLGTFDMPGHISKNLKASVVKQM